MYVRRLRLVVAALCVVPLAGCDDTVSHHVADGPITAPVTARGLTAGLLRHLDAEHVTSYGGEHSGPNRGVESWSSLASLDGQPRSVYVFASVVPGGFDPGCEPDGPPYVEVSCTTAANGAKRSLMERKGGNSRMPVLSGRTTRVDGTSFLVEVFADEPSAEAEALILDLLEDEALGALTTAALNAAGEELDHYEQLTQGVTVDRPLP